MKIITLYVQKKCCGDTQLALIQHIMKKIIEICIHLMVWMIDFLFLFFCGPEVGKNKNLPICTMLFFYIHKFTLDFNCTKQRVWGTSS